MYNSYLEEDAVEFSAEFTAGIGVTGGIQQVIGWYTMEGNTLTATDHPYYHIRHAVLRLK